MRISNRRRNRDGRTLYRRLRAVGVTSGLVVGLGISPGALAETSEPQQGLAPPSGDAAIQTARFTDARRQAAEFIAYDDTIVLTAEQQKLMSEALSSIPAPCCSSFSIATCCCPCNLARSSWGLAKFLIVNERASATGVKAVVQDWLRFTNSDGYSGDACFTKGCNRSFAENGCGGMDPSQVR